MIDFALDDRMEALREFLHGFAVDELRPRARAADLAGTVEPEVIARLGEMAGDRAAIVPPLRSDEDLDGGPRSDGMVAVVGGEELAWGDAAMILNIPGPGLAGPSISSAGTPDQHRRFLTEIFDGQGPRFGALAVTEAQAGSGHGRSSLALTLAVGGSRAGARNLYLGQGFEWQCLVRLSLHARCDRRLV